MIVLLVAMSVFSLGFQIFVGKVGDEGHKVVVENLRISCFGILVEETGEKNYDIKIEDAGEIEECVSYYESCRCVGLLWTSREGTQQYTCFGFNYCREISLEGCVIE